MSRKVVLAGLALIAIGVAAVYLTRPATDLAVCAPERPANSSNHVTPPDDVFCYQASATGEEILVDFTIDDGAYLYRDDFGFSSPDPAIVLGAARIPPGEIHYDESFEEDKEIYRHQLQVAIPYTRTAEIDSFELGIRLRGCDETIGLCYPAQDWSATVALPEGPITASPSTASPVPAGGLPGSLFGGDDADEPLPIDQAFIPNPRFDSANELTLAWQIAPGYYLYRDDFTFTVNAGDLQFGQANLPAGVMHDDLEFGEVEVYYDYVEAVVPFARPYPQEQEITITAGYRGCKDGSICYPSDERQLTLTLPAATDFVTSSSSVAPVKVSEQDRFAALLANGSWFAVLGGFYLGGLLLSFTPCVLPMVPILSGIIAGQGKPVSGGHGFALSGTYVLGMAFTYTVAGVLAALAGSQIQAVFQQPWIIASFAGLFVIMALGMFGLFEIQMPAAVQSRISALANRQKGGTFIGTAIVGALTALIVTTCVAPVLIGALAYIGQTGDVVRGGSALFVLSMGMGTPLLLVGASAGQLLPKVGPWMNMVKAGFGVMMLGLAIWMLDRLLPGAITLVLWALLVFMTGVFLGAFEALPEHPRTSRRFAKGLGVLACLYGAILLIGSTLGGESPLRPFPNGVGAFAGAPAAANEPEFIAVKSVAELESRLAEARGAGQPVIVDFTAWWCSDCTQMEKYTFPDPTVMTALEPYMALRADVSDNTDDDKALMAYFGTYGPPTIVFFDRSGRQLENFELLGYKKAREFAAHVNEVAAL